MAIDSKTFAIIGSVIGGAGLAALILSFASDRWLQASNFEETGFANLGLWSICFEGKYRPPPHAAVSREYEGCWWALNKELDDLRNFLFPGWFKSTQILVTLGLVLALIVTIMLLINFINCFPRSPHKQRIKRILALASTLLLSLSAILLCSAVILFGVKATDTRTWIQKPDNNYLSWSYGMCILAVFLFAIASMCLLLQFIRLRAELDYTDGSEPKIMLTNEPPPATHYRYSPGRNARVSEGPALQPAYVQRYTKNQESSPPPRYPGSPFAVSGAGEVYINRLADYDDFRDGYRERGRKGQPPPWHQPKADAKKSNQELDTSVDGTYTGSDYEKSKNMEHPVIPEYTPRSARKANEKKSESISDTETVDSVSKDVKKKNKDKKGEQKGERKSRSSSRKKRSNSRDRSRSGSRSRRRNISESENSDSESTKKRSKHRSRSKDVSEDERSRSHRRSKRGSKRRRKSRSKSRDRDNNTTYSDSQLDSDSGSVRSRSRRRHEKDSKKRSSHEDLSRKDKRRHSSSDKHKKKKSRDGNLSDDKFGSEYSQRHSRKKEGRDSDVESKKRLRDFSETESVRSNRSRSKPKGTYSSYYE